MNNSKVNSKSQKKISRALGQAIGKYNLIEESDRIMIAVSGGKDSIAMLYFLNELIKKAPIKFEIFAYTLDQSQPGYDSSQLKKFYQELGVEHYIITKDTYSIVTDKIEEGKTYCSLCSRLRRGILYNEAQRLGATKIALGHHSDDAIETLLLNLFYAGKTASMPAIFKSDDKRNVVIRPLILAREKDIETFSNEMNFPIIPCNLCGSQDNLKRQQIKNWLNTQEETNKTIRASISSALGNISPSHLLDEKLFPFKSISAKQKDLA